MDVSRYPFPSPVLYFQVDREPKFIDVFGGLRHSTSRVYGLVTQFSSFKFSHGGPFVLQPNLSCVVIGKDVYQRLHVCEALEIRNKLVC